MNIVILIALAVIFFFCASALRTHAHLVVEAEAECIGDTNTDRFDEIFDEIFGIIWIFRAAAVLCVVVAGIHYFL